MQELEVAETKTPSKRIASPTATMETVNKTLRGLFAYKKTPATYKDISASVGGHETVVSLGLSTARDLGLLRLAGKKGLYDFTPDGTEYCRYLTSNMTQESRNVLRRTLLNNPLWADIIGFLRANTENPRDPIEIVLDVEGKLGKKWSPGMRKTVMDSFVSVLEYAELARKESGNIVSHVRPDTGMTQPTTIERYGPIPTIEPTFPTSASTPSRPAEYYEFKGDGFYLKMRNDSQTVTKVYKLVGLFKTTADEERATTDLQAREEAPGK